MIANSTTISLSSPLIEGESCLIGKFQAMGCPCEIVMDTQKPGIGRSLLEVATKEAERIERKFSRYQSDSVVSQVNGNLGMPLEVDDETSNLLDYANRCFEMSDGLFDVTTGVLRKIWRFDSSSQMVAKDDVKRLLPYVGWKKIRWARPFLQVPAGMEIDFGGIC